MIINIRLYFLSYLPVSNLMLSIMKLYVVLFFFLQVATVTRKHLFP